MTDLIGRIPAWYQIELWNIFFRIGSRFEKNWKRFIEILDLNEIWFLHSFMEVIKRMLQLAKEGERKRGKVGSWETERERDRERDRERETEREMRLVYQERLWEYQQDGQFLVWNPFSLTCFFFFSRGGKFELSLQQFHLFFPKYALGCAVQRWEHHFMS